MPNPNQLRRARFGPRPRTQRYLPHIQLDQWPEPEVFEKLSDGCLALPHVRERQSRMSASDTRALWLPDEKALGPPEAFIDDHEFCHVHALPTGSLHLTLPSGVRERMIQLEWGESHPSSTAGFLAKTLVMIYAPRDDQELAVVLSLLNVSCEFAKGTSE